MFYKKINCSVCNRNIICRSEKNFPGIVYTWNLAHQQCRLMKYIYRVKIKKEVINI